MTTQLTLQHLDFMIDLRRSSKKIEQISASRVRIANDLQRVGFIKVDDEHNLFNSERGDIILDGILRVFHTQGNL